MNTSKIIDKIDRLKPNALNESDLIDMVNEVEGDIYINVLRKDPLLYTPITPSTKSEPLSVTAPYEHIYFEYLCAKIDLLNGNIESYSLSANQFNQTMADYKAYVSRTQTRPNTTRTDYF